MIILDDKHTAALRSAQTKKAAEQFITRYMADNDLAAVITTSGQARRHAGVHQQQAPAAARRERFIGQKLRSETEERLDEYQRQQRGPAQARGSRGSTTRSTCSAATTRASRSRRCRASPTGSAAFAAAARRSSSSAKASTTTSTTSTSARRRRSRRRCARSSPRRRAPTSASTRSTRAASRRSATRPSRSPAAFPADPQLNLSLQSFNDALRLSQDSLRSLSEETGGFAAVNRNDFSDAFSRVVKDSSSYYVLGYYPKNDRRDGRFRKIEVKVKRPGLEVRSRRGYTAPRGKAPTPPKVPAGDKTSPQVREALDSPLPLPAPDAERLCRAVQGHRAEHRRGRHHRGGRQRLRRSRRRTASCSPTTRCRPSPSTQRGKIRGGDRSVVNFALKPENRQRFAQTGVRVSTRLQLPPGRYQLRVAARESATGRVGSVNYDLDVPGLHQGTDRGERHRHRLGLGPADVDREARRGAEGRAARTAGGRPDVPARRRAGRVRRGLRQRGQDAARRRHHHDGRQRGRPQRLQERAKSAQSSELQGKPGGYGTRRASP